MNTWNHGQLKPPGPAANQQPLLGIDQASVAEGLVYQKGRS